MDKRFILDNIEKAFAIRQLTSLQEKMSEIEREPFVMLIAPTGSGKTLAFVLNILRYINPESDKVQCVVVVPARELAIQVGDVIKKAAGSSAGAVVCYGGHSFENEARSLKHGVNIVVGTPGRLADHIHRKTIDISSAENLVLDEFDKSLELGYAKEMREIVRSMKSRKRTVLTSATVLEPLPEWLDAKKVFRLEESVDECESRSKVMLFEVKCYVADKLDLLSDLLLSIPYGKTLVFVNHRESAERVFSYLKKKGFGCVLFHGGMEQHDRENALEMFRNGTAPVMVCTDLAARGLDIEGVENIIHYHLPVNREAWTHRNGRTARMNNRGDVYVITSERDTLPEYINFDSEYQPNPRLTVPQESGLSTIYLNLGKKDKISKGDIVGYILNNSVIETTELGRITLRDHSATVAIPRTKCDVVIEQLNAAKIKNKRVKVSLLQ